MNRQSPKKCPETVSIEECARMLGVSRNTAYEAAKRGEIPTIRIGRRLLVPLVALRRMLEGENRDPALLDECN